MNPTDLQMEDNEAGTGRSGGAAVIRRRWSIGKRVAIAGAAITCAPFLIPPLFVLSVLGVAFSLPSGIYLAGYACTDRIMSALLPLPDVQESNNDCIDSKFEDNLCLKEGIEGGSPKTPYGVVVMGSGEDSERGNEPSNLSQEHLSIVEVSGEGKSEGVLEEMQQKGLPEVVCRREVELPRLLSESLLSKKEDCGEVETMEHNSVAKSGINAVVGGVGLSGVHNDVERIYDEEQLWEQIMAMRTIVGYKIPMKASFGEELRALYLFIGVEPPLSLKDMSELVKSLQFLKFVVGVE